MISINFPRQESAVYLVIFLLTFKIPVDMWKQHKTMCGYRYSVSCWISMVLTRPIYMFGRFEGIEGMDLKMTPYIGFDGGEQRRPQFLGCSHSNLKMYT